MCDSVELNVLNAVTITKLIEAKHIYVSVWESFLNTDVGFLTDTTRYGLLYYHILIDWYSKLRVFRDLYEKSEWVKHT